MNGTPEAAESFWINKQQHILSSSSLCVGIWSKTLITLDICKKDYPTFSLHQLKPYTLVYIVKFISNVPRSS